ncbi:MAG: CheR family methyltransferase [Lentisphaerota bacterium]
MNNNVMEPLGDSVATGLTRLGELVTARIGLHFPENRQQDLLCAARTLAAEHGQEDAEAYLQSLLSAPLTDRQMEILTAQLTVGETYFFREMKSLDAFRNHIIPDLMRRRTGSGQPIRIWSAGCSTGEEAYTIAMLLSELIPNLNTMGADILATDINADSLEKARRGIYTEWSFRGMSESQRERYFEPQGKKKFAVKSRFRDMVTFACHNLATDPYPALQNNTNAMDVIFCRNVLMYFVPELIQKVIGHFRHSLVDGGWLIVSPSEGSLPISPEFAAVPFDGATLYRKDNNKPLAGTGWLNTSPTTANAAVGVGTFDTPPAFSKWVAPETKGKAFASPAVTPHSTLRINVKEPYEEALAAYQQGRYAAAATALHALFGSNGAAASSPATGNAFALMARINANQGKLDHAVEWAEKAVAADKVNPGFYYLLATILEEQHHPADAVQALKRAIYLDSKFILAHFALGNIALQENGRKGAARHFLNAAALLTQMPKNKVLPESEGVTAGRLLEIIESMTV